MKILRILFAVLFMIYSSVSLAHEIKSFAPIVKKTLPAVVSIRTKIAGVNNAKLFDNMQIPKEMEEMLEEFFKDRRRGKKQNVQQGSGFIFDKAGYVLTNYHVIHRGTTVEVILQDGTIYQTEVKGVDPLTDLAVLKIKNFKKPLPVIKFADSNASQVGDWVIAIGNPLGLGGTVTKGIVSARGRNIHSGLYDDYIQTDTPINRGNSGGPLINLDGKVIGVNTVIYSPTGGSIGLGFAISSNLAKDISSQLVKKGSVSRAWFGVGMRPVTGEIADSLSLKQIEGSIITSVVKGSPADKAGIKVGDVIFSVDGKMITKKNRLAVLIARAPINVPVTFEIYRGGKIKKVKIKLEKRDDKTALVKTPMENDLVKTEQLPRTGLLVSELDKHLRDKYKYGKNAKGVVITGIAPSSAAYGMIKQGMIITQINSVDITSTKDAIKVVLLAIKQNKKNVLLIVKDNKGTQQLITISIR